MLQCRFIGMETVRPCKFVQFVNGTGKWSFGKIVVINDDIIFGNPNTTDCTASGLPDLPAPFCPHPIIQEDLFSWSRMTTPAGAILSDGMTFGFIKEEGNELFLKGISWHTYNLIGSKKASQRFTAPAKVSYTSRPNRIALILGTVWLHPLLGRPPHGDATGPRLERETFGTKTQRSTN